jgi:fructokinase
MPADLLPRPIVFGEVLFDQFPDGSVVAGGAPFNVAWHLTAFGADPLFISRVGDDPLGHRIRGMMADWGMDRAGLQKDSAHPTGTVRVTIEDGEPSYEIVADRAWDHIDADSLPPFAEQGLLYHGSLALRSASSAKTLQRLRSRLPATALLDVNLRDPWWQAERVLADIGAADWVKLNGEELRRLLPDSVDEAAAVAALQADNGPSLVIVTHGEAGATAWRAGQPPLRVAPSTAASVVDTVGAGDAFASVLLLGRWRGWDLTMTLQRAQAFAAALVGVRGATVNDVGFYRCFRQQWGIA